MTGMLSDRVRNPEQTDVRRRFLAASVAGALVALLLFTVVLQGGRDGLFGSDLLGNFYDGQARAILDGHLDVDPAVPGFEGFRIGDRTYIYQGLTPALLRLPVVALTHSLDGRLTGVSMLAAMSVLLTYVVAASWRLRVLLRGSAPIRTGELVLTAVATFGLGSGSVLFLASRAWVYHEAQLWGVALSLASLVHLVYWLSSERNSGRGHWATLVASVVFAGLALNTRSSIALGPFAALGAVGVLVLIDVVLARTPQNTVVGRIRSWLFAMTAWRPQPSVRRGVAVLAILGVGLSAGLGFYAVVNHARFGSAFGVPLDRQLLVQNDPARREALDANNGSLFGLQFAPSVALQLLRPDALSTRSAFPYLGFPDARPTVIGSAVFAERDWSSSVPASEPLLFLGSIAGLLVLAIPRRMLGDSDSDSDADADTSEDADSDGSALSPHQRVKALRVPIVGAAGGAAAILVFGYMAQRYVSDLYPFLVLSAALGLHVIATRLDLSRMRGSDHSAIANAEAGGVRVGYRVAAVGTAVVVVVSSIWGAWANSALAWQYQREIAPGFTSVGRGSWLDLQLSLPGSVPWIRVDSVEDLPAPEPKGTVAVVGDCSALYRSSGDVWRLVESGDAGGSTRIRVRSDSPLLSVILATARAESGLIALSLHPISGDMATLDFPGTLVASKVDFDLGSDTDGAFELDLDVVYDELEHTVTVTRHGTRHELLRTLVTLHDLQAVKPRSTSVSVEASPLPTPLCHAIVDN